MRDKKFRYRGTASEIMPSVNFAGVEIKVLRHGNTGHILYCAPRMEDGEPCWFMDLETAKKQILKQKNEGVKFISVQESSG